MPQQSAPSALIVVDYQHDFCDPKGSLYIPGGETIHSKILAKMRQFRQQGHLVVAAKDWHPAQHSSFNIWPVHGVQNTWGAQMPFRAQEFDFVVHKGQHPRVDSYSAFFDHADRSNGLHEWLQQRHVTTVVVVGLATDVCVSATVQHAVELGYRVVVDLDCCRGTKNHLVLEPVRRRP